MNSKLASAAQKHLLFLNDQRKRIRVLGAAALVQGTALTYMCGLAVTEMRTSSDNHELAPLSNRLALGAGFLGLGAVGVGAVAFWSSRSVHSLSLSRCGQFVDVVTYNMFGSLKERSYSRIQCHYLSPTNNSAYVKIEGRAGAFLLDPKNASVFDSLTLQRALP